jgi:hypothetical protein
LFRQRRKWHSATGGVKTPIHYLQARTWGLLGWARQLISVFMDGVSDTVEHQLGWLLPDQDGKPRYFRFQTELPPGMGSMDDTSPQRIEALKQAATTLISSNIEKLDALCELLTAEAPTRIKVLYVFQKLSRSSAFTGRLPEGLYPAAIAASIACAAICWNN